MDLFWGPRHVKHGVPQGSILRPTLSILYINDLSANLRASDVNYYLFADDLGINVHSSNLRETYDSTLACDVC